MRHTVRHFDQISKDNGIAVAFFNNLAAFVMGLSPGGGHGRTITNYLSHCGFDNELSARQGRPPHGGHSRLGGQAGSRVRPPAAYASVLHTTR